MINKGETLIFDLDGTLVDSSGFEDECFIGALRDILGDVDIETDWSHYEHVTDAGILTQIVEELTDVDSDVTMREVRERFGERVKDYFNAGGLCPAIRGVNESLPRLVENGYRLGIATGGWRHTAELKLDRAGIDTTGLVLSTCDDAMDRVGIMANCLDRLGGGEGKVVYFGDGPWDARATERLGWRFIGVGRRLAGKCYDSIIDFRDPKWTFAPNNAMESDA